LVSLNNNSFDLILVTGGLSVDPDDITREGIQKAGTKIIFYGTPVLPGAMFLYGMLGEKPVLGLPACVFHHSATLFDIIFPRILVGEVLTRREISLLGHGASAIIVTLVISPYAPLEKDSFNLRKDPAMGFKQFS
jgi:molybdopterin biosynthesis enzyme